MDLGLKGRTALICASSQGLGLACARSLAREGCSVIVNGRDANKLARVVETLRSDGGDARSITADLTTADGRTKLVRDAGEIDILINNNAGPPPGELADWDHAALLSAFEANMIPAILLMRAVIPGMRRRRFGRIVNITSAMVKSPRPAMGLSTSARTALTAISKAISLDVAVDNVTINNLLPERIDTPRQEFMAKRIMDEQSVDREEARRQIVASIAAKRFGLAEELGDACAYLCSAQAGFISGQNLQLDGGSYPGLI